MKHHLQHIKAQNKNKNYFTNPSLTDTHKETRFQCNIDYILRSCLSLFFYLYHSFLGFASYLPGCFLITGYLSSYSYYIFF